MCSSDLAAELGLPLNHKKRQAPSQRVTYTGITIDTVVGRMFIPPEKLDKLLDGVQRIIAAGSITPRQLESASGRLRHYAMCILHVRPLVPSISAGCLGEHSASLDSPQPVSPALRAAAQSVLSVVERYAPLGSPLWPFIPSSLYGAFLRNETRGMHLFVATYDAAQPGYGAVVRCDDDRDGANGLLVGTFPRGSPVGEQVHREALACPLVLEAMSRTYQIGRAHV